MTRQSRAQLIAEYLTLRLQPGREAPWPAAALKLKVPRAGTGARSLSQKAPPQAAQTSRPPAPPPLPHAVDLPQLTHEHIANPSVTVSVAEMQPGDHLLGQDDGGVVGASSQGAAGDRTAHGGLRGEKEDLDDFPAGEKEREAQLAIQQELLDIAGSECTYTVGWVKFSERKKTVCGSCKICKRP